MNSSTASGLHCAKCLAARWSTDPVAVTNNVAVIGRAGAQALCRCRRCGHQYRTSSVAALRELDRMEVKR